MKKFFAVMGVFLITFSLAFVAMTILASKSETILGGGVGEREGGVMGGLWGLEGLGGEGERGDWIKPYPEGTMFLAWWTFLGDYGESFPYLQGFILFYFALFCLFYFVVVLICVSDILLPFPSSQLTSQPLPSPPSPLETYVGMSLLSVYVLLSQVLLANLLIAIMTDSYSDIRENADKEWKFNRFAFLNQFSTSDVLPSPFNILSQGAGCVGGWWGGGGGGRERAESLTLHDAHLKLKRKRDQVIFFLFFWYFYLLFIFQLFTFFFFLTPPTGHCRQ